MREEITLDSWNDMGTSPWRYLRYAEILLNYAEAQNETLRPDVSVFCCCKQSKKQSRYYQV